MSIDLDGGKPIALTRPQAVFFYEICVIEPAALVHLRGQARRTVGGPTWMEPQLRGCRLAASVPAISADGMTVAGAVPAISADGHDSSGYYDLLA